MGHALYLRVYGERNSGTNFVEQLIRENFAVTCLQSKNRVNDHIEVMRQGMSDAEYGQFRVMLMDIDSERVRMSDFGWKHGTPPEREVLTASHTIHTLFVCVAKHPVSWLRSVFARPYSPLEPTPCDFDDFLKYEMPVSGRDNLPGHQRINVVDLWNLKNAAYAALPTLAPRCIVTAYERILADPPTFLDAVGQHLLRIRSPYVWSFPSTKGDGLGFEDYRSKYELANARRMVTPAQLGFISQRVDRQTMAEFGYDCETLRTEPNLEDGSFKLPDRPSKSDTAANQSKFFRPHGLLTKVA